MLRKGFNPWKTPVENVGFNFFNRIKEGALMRINDFCNATNFSGFTINIGPIGLNFDWSSS